MFLKIETDEGVVGWGEPVIEGRARTVEAAVHELSDYLIGQDPSRINDLWQVMYRAGFYRGGPILMSAIAGSTALWDIKGKVLNAPVWQLMGGPFATKLKPTVGSAAIVRRMLSTALKRYAKSASIPSN